jgi:hypothetical protein
VQVYISPALVGSFTARHFRVRIRNYPKLEESVKSRINYPGLQPDQDDGFHYVRNLGFGFAQFCFFLFSIIPQITGNLHITLD